MKLNELPPKTLIKQAHAGVKLITEQYPEAAAILREAITRFDVLREVHQLGKQEEQPESEPYKLPDERPADSSNGNDAEAWFDEGWNACRAAIIKGDMS